MFIYVSHSEHPLSLTTIYDRFANRGDLIFSKIDPMTKMILMKMIQKKMNLKIIVSYLKFIYIKYPIKYLIVKGF